MTAPTHSHVIDDMVFDISFDADNAGEMLQARQDELQPYLLDRLFPAIDAICNRYAHADAVLVLDRVELDLGDVPADNFRDEIVQRVELQLADLLRRQLDEAKSGKKSGAALIPHMQRAIEQLQTFLTDGVLAGRGHAADPASHQRLLDRAIAENPSELIAFLKRSSARREIIEQMIERLAGQFSDASLRQLVGLLSQDAGTDIAAAIDTFLHRHPAASGAQNRQIRRKLWRTTIATLLKNTSKDAAKDTLLHEVDMESRAFATPADLPEMEDKAMPDTPQTSYFHSSATNHAEENRTTQNRRAPERLRHRLIQTLQTGSDREAARELIGELLMQEHAAMVRDALLALSMQQQVSERLASALPSALLAELVSLLHPRVAAYVAVYVRALLREEGIPAASDDSSWTSRSPTPSHLLDEGTERRFMQSALVELLNRDHAATTDPAEIILRAWTRMRDTGHADRSHPVDGGGLRIHAGQRPAVDEATARQKDFGRLMLAEEEAKRLATLPHVVQQAFLHAMQTHVHAPFIADTAIPAHRATDEAERTATAASVGAGTSPSSNPIDRPRDREDRRSNDHAAEFWQLIADALVEKALRSTAGRKTAAEQAFSSVTANTKLPASSARPGLPMQTKPASPELPGEARTGKASDTAPDDKDTVPSILLQALRNGKSSVQDVSPEYLQRLIAALMTERRQKKLQAADSHAIAEGTQKTADSIARMRFLLANLLERQGNPGTHIERSAVDDANESDAGFENETEANVNKHAAHNASTTFASQMFDAKEVSAVLSGLQQVADRLAHVDTADRDANMLPSDRQSRLQTNGEEAVTKVNQAEFVSAIKEKNLRHLLAKAFLNGDPAMLRPEWPLLLQRYPALIVQAWRHYAAMPGVNRRLAAGFPQAMLVDLLNLLAPRAMESLAGSMERTGSTGLPDARTTSSERILLWERTLHYFLERTGGFDVEDFSAFLGDDIDDATSPGAGTQAVTADEGAEEIASRALLQVYALYQQIHDALLGKPVADTEKRPQKNPDAPIGQAGSMKTADMENAVELPDTIDTGDAAHAVSTAEAFEIVSSRYPALARRLTRALRHGELSLEHLPFDEPLFASLLRALLTGMQEVPDKVSENQQRFLNAIASHAVRATDKSLYYRRVIAALLEEKEIDLEVLVEQGDADVGGHDRHDDADAAAQSAGRDRKIPGLSRIPVDVVVDTSLKAAAGLPSATNEQRSSAVHPAEVHRQLFDVLTSGAKHQEGHDVSTVNRLIGGISQKSSRHAQAFWTALRSHVSSFSSSLSADNWRALIAACLTNGLHRSAQDARAFLASLDAAAAANANANANASHYYRQVLLDMLQRHFPDELSNAAGSSASVTASAVPQPSRRSALQANPRIEADAAFQIASQANSQANFQTTYRNTSPANSQAVNAVIEQDDEPWAAERLAQLLSESPATDSATRIATAERLLHWLETGLATHAQALRTIAIAVLKNETHAATMARMLPERQLARLLMEMVDRRADWQLYADWVEDVFCTIEKTASPQKNGILKWRYLLHRAANTSGQFDRKTFVEDFSRVLIRENGSLQATTLHAALQQADAPLRIGTGQPPVQASTVQAGSSSVPVQRASSSITRSRPHGESSTEKEGDGKAQDIHEQEIYVPNAGQVLAAPYMPRLFAMLKLTENGKFVDRAAAERAVHLLQFMVDERTATPEYQLVLNKILCGIKTGIPIAGGIDIADQERETIEALIQGMIDNWGSIGKTSIQGLRTSFLQRPGWLRMQDDAWHLQVEPKPYDMLLDRLPWSFSMIKHGWMPQMLNVDWR